MREYRLWDSHNCVYEEYFFLLYDAVYSVENQLTFQMNIAPSSSGSNKPRKIPNRLATCFHASILLGLFDPEDWGNMFLRNFGWLSTDYMALYPRRYYSSNERMIMNFEEGEFGKLRLFSTFKYYSSIYCTWRDCRKSWNILCRTARLFVLFVVLTKVFFLPSSFVCFEPWPAYRLRWITRICRDVPHCRHASFRDNSISCLRSLSSNLSFIHDDFSKSFVRKNLKLGILCTIKHGKGRTGW
jgi:hypothetical protein